MTAPVTAPAVEPAVRCLDRTGIQPWLPLLDEWLLPGNAYSVHHTWPLLYRSDGWGSFFAILADDRLVSHCATRDVTIRGEHGAFDATLLGSVATDPELRGRGLAGRVLAAALADCDARGRPVLLWAERPELYARHGFVPGRPERCALLARRPLTAAAGEVRLAEVRDHGAIHALHEQKPWCVVRTAAETSGLLTTPGLRAMVSERDGAVVAYACCGKGADLQDHWHEVGGADADVAALLQAAMHHCGQIEAVLLVPPYRPGLCDALGRSVVDEFCVEGPMTRSASGGALPACWIDGLDSV
ncbi:MAG: GNAT family N-acetyltransferase [Planctomycetes bacterium]|nr:GNAT family N-acetyltransferase [Planctomycetota bacterium]